MLLVTNINFTGLTEFEAKEIAYQTCFLMMNGWQKARLNYDLFEKERPDLYFDKRKGVDLRFEERNHLWIKSDYMAEVSYHPNGFQFETKTSKYFTLEEAYDYQINKI